MSRDLLKLISEKFTSGNSIEVERITITRAEYEAELAKPEQEPCGWVNELGVFSKSYPTDFVYSWKPVYASPFNITLMAGKSK